MIAMTRSRTPASTSSGWTNVISKPLSESLKTATPITRFGDAALDVTQLQLTATAPIQYRDENSISLTS
jgi:hypothetical protein